jgi:hypothetical protein
MERFEKKITVSKVLGGKVDITALDLKKKRRIVLIKLIGILYQIKSGTTELGQYVKLIGDHEATNLITGVKIRATVCKLPKFITNALKLPAGYYRKQKGSISYAINIGIEYDQAAPRGFNYFAESTLTGAAEAPSPLEAIKEKIMLATPL